METLRILIADDHPLFRDGLRALLMADPAAEIVGEAATGDEAVTLAAELQPDVILMDIGLPYLDGIEATHCIRRACPHKVIICLTGHFSPPKYSAMKTAGAAAFVCKNQVLAIHETIMYALGQWTMWE